MAKQGLFVGLITLDFIYSVNTYPHKNQKIVASNYSVVAGGPATNAAVTFNSLGNPSTLLGVLGSHPLTQLIRADLQYYNVNLVDLDPTRLEAPPVSSIIVTPETGDRMVVSINATKSQVSNFSNLPQFLDNIDIILIDGHQIPMSQIIIQQAKTQKIPIILDGGSWKPGLETILPHITYAICSNAFYPPNCQTSEDVFNYLKALNIPYIAITQGEKPIEYATLKEGSGKISVPTIQAIDTLGAGDIFHGAFCHFILSQNFTTALAESAKIAAQSCQHFGTRQWIQFWEN
ncbi:sugar kinase [Planktothrix pseudagardhii]|uniref:Sulfofructose kinase n=1 Tax=Planktothrix pseudagardhii TaxID=132604 RepID=A0A9W4CF43_9CYAN|nr:sugar kinase [Planktothrix pseudagardhii]CAD5918677.1 Sulfofructose kinase [Planktothrix pseudagardhii]